MKIGRSAYSRRRATGTRRAPIQHEKTEQSHAVQLLRTIGAVVFVIGTRRPAGSKCPSCGTFVREHQGTCQTAGIADLYAVLPARQGSMRRALWVEMKAPDGKMSKEQRDFQALCLLADVAHVVGGFNAVIAWLLEHEYIREHQVPHYRLPAERRPADPSWRTPQ